MLKGKLQISFSQENVQKTNNGYTYIPAPLHMCLNKKGLMQKWIIIHFKKQNNET